jgi:RNA 2',3'-cyclic 3'-phosphodiesterase
LFVATEIGEALAAQVEDLSSELQKRTAKAAPRAKVTWIPAQRMHLSIRFIGEVDDSRATALRTALAPPIEVAPFELTLAGAGTFPKSGTPRVVWVGVTRGREELLAAERQVSARLIRVGVPREERPYSPHLTLARVREPAGLRSAQLLDGLTHTTIGTVRVDAITLFQSKLSPKGPTYLPLLRIPLQEAGG